MAVEEKKRGKQIDVLRKENKKTDFEQQLFSTFVPNH